MDFKKLFAYFQNCDCGQDHACNIRDIRIGKGLISSLGKILEENGFSGRLLLVSDEKALAAAAGAEDSLQAFHVEKRVYKSMRVATMTEVNAVEEILNTRADCVLAVGSGSVDDICRLASARAKKPLCLFATAPSMDGFASDGAPIVDNNFKATYPAKSPEVIVADTEILAKAPTELKSAGFGDMMAKYVALIDWSVSNLISGEPLCEKVYALTRYAADLVYDAADKVTECDEESARKIFEGLLLTGIAMSFTKTSRPGSGTEHIMAHYIDCKDLAEGKLPRYHGVDVGLCTLIMLRFYETVAKVGFEEVFPEENDWTEIERVYGSLAEGMKALNTPDTITDRVDLEKLRASYPKMKEIIRSVPSYEEVRSAMEKAGCETDYGKLGVDEAFLRESFLYHPYMRRRLSLFRLLNMTELKTAKETFPLTGKF